MKPAERVRHMLMGQPVDHIPFTVYDNKLTWGRAERELRTNGMCILQKEPNFFTISYPNCRISVTVQQRNGQSYETTRMETSAGVLEKVDVLRPRRLNWNQEPYFKSESDYGPLRAALQDETYHENYQAVQQMEQRGGGDLFMRGRLGYSPLHTLIYYWMGLERFCFEWLDNRRRVLELYEILSEKYLTLARIGARSPLLVINVCGNVTAIVTSPTDFKNYYIPLYDKAADILHQGGKLAGVHFDGVTAPFADAIAASRIDIVEALCPPPTCDVSVAQAHEYWPDKIIWINFPSSLHLASAERIREATLQILEEARPHERFLVGITEDVPEDRWPENFRIILETIKGHSRCDQP